MKTIFNFKNSSIALTLGCLALVLFSFSGCEKHEGEAGAAGTATGAILGMAVTGRDTKSKLLGTADRKSVV